MNALEKQTQANKNLSLLKDRVKRKWKASIQAKSGSGVAFNLEDMLSHPAACNPSEQFYVITGEPGSGKTTHLKLYIKSMIKLLGAATYIVDANPTFKFTPDYSNAYHNLIEEFYGKVFTTDNLCYQALRQVKTVAGIDVGSLSSIDNYSARLEFVMQLAQRLQQEASAKDRHTLLVLEDIKHLGLLDGNKKSLHKLAALVNNNFFVALSTQNFSDILNLGFSKDDLIITDLGDRKTPQHQGVSQ